MTKIKTGGWGHFLNQEVRVIINDNPSPYPKHKDGLVKGFTNTHLIILQDNKEIALLLTDIRRVEIKNGINGKDGNSGKYGKGYYK